MKTPSDKKTKFGTVYLVGAGPGDPNLLTLRGKALLETADAVFYDHLVHPEILKFCPQAELRYVGKVGHAESISQELIEADLFQAAERFSAIVRLKGGDPFIFGRGGEEAEYLSRRGIPFEIVPGVSSAIAVPAYAGIPLTHRSLASKVSFVTGHEDPEKSESEPDKKEDVSETTVMLMSVKTLRSNLEKQIQMGRPPATPAALIEWGTYPRQRTLIGTLSTLADLAETQGIQAPAIAVIGDVVGLRERLKWFEIRPLFGKRILVTRARHQASALAQPLREWGAEVVELPTIEIQAPNDWSQTDAALANLSQYSWILFTSVHGVDAFLGRLLAVNGDIRSLGFAKLAAVGPATAQRLKDRGLGAERISEEFSGERLAQSFSEPEIRGRRLLLARAETGGEEIERELRKKGATLDVVPVYRNVLPQYSDDFLNGLLSQETFDLLTFTSPSTLKNLATLIQARPQWKKIMETQAAVIGPVTKKTAEEIGLRVVAMPQEATLECFLREIYHCLTPPDSELGV